MFKKKIYNIVFYKIENNSEKQACIFLEDGTVKNVSFEEGIDACEELVREYNIVTRNAFQEMINNQLVHVMSGKEFTRKFKSFIPEQTVIDTKEQEISHIEESNDVLTSTQVPAVEDNTVEEEITQKAQIEEPEEVISADEEERREEAFEDAKKAVEQETSRMEEEQAEATQSKEVSTEDSEENIPVEEPTESEADKIAAAYADMKASLSDDEEQFVTGTGEDNPFEEEMETPIDTDIEDENVESITEEDNPVEKKGLIRRIIDKIKNNKLIKRITVCVTALALATGLFACSNKQTLEGQMINSNLTTTTTTDSKDYTSGNITILAGNNAYYNDYTFEQLQEVTTNLTQKTAMANLDTTIVGFNEQFASNYLESGKDVRAALKFDEIIALQMAYNDYTKKDIQAIFNGAEIRSDDLVRSYKDASLQLMGAYAIENSQNPLDMSTLLTTEEGKEFYNKYHTAFLAAKEATGEDQIRKVNEFYAMVKEDFPITQEVRTEGISHSENYDKIESYKLSVTPMIAAGEMMWQNLRVDNTLKDGEIDFLNDLGLCNYAEETFERIETITLTSNEDEENPTYEQYRNAIIEKMTEKGYYYIDDEHRELTKLDSFQNAVNGHFNATTNINTQAGGKTTTTTTTRQEVETHTDTTTTYTEEVTRVEKPIPANVQAQIDAQIAAENEQARIAAEQQAEAERRRLQAIEDENARRIQAEIAKEEQDLQNKINNVNNIINNNNSDTNKNNDIVINESDFGDHEVHFDPQHQDGNGNLNNSVQNITTDPTGDKTNQALPDPNETGARFDAQAPKSQSTSVQLPTTGQESSTQQTTTSSDVPAGAETAIDNNGNEYNFWVEETTPTGGSDGWTEVSGIQIDPEYQGFVQPSTQSNEQIVNDYVEGLTNNGEEFGEGYQYTLQ